MNSCQPIGVFDSGLGGLTVLAALRARLPGEDFIYFADTHFLPYGDRPESFIQARGQAIAAALVERGAKAIVVACNTATAAAAELIRAAIPKPVVALEPAVKPAAGLTRTGVVGVLATTRTLASGRFQRLVQTYAESVQVISQACPGLAEAIETEGPDSPRVQALLDEYLQPLARAAPMWWCWAAPITPGCGPAFRPVCPRASSSSIPARRWPVRWSAAFRAKAGWAAMANCNWPPAATRCRCGKPWRGCGAPSCR